MVYFAPVCYLYYTQLVLADLAVNNGIKLHIVSVRWYREIEGNLYIHYLHQFALSEWVDAFLFGYYHTRYKISFSKCLLNQWKFIILISCPNIGIYNTRSKSSQTAHQPISRLKRLPSSTIHPFVHSVNLKFFPF